MKNEWNRRDWLRSSLLGFGLLTVCEPRLARAEGPITEDNIRFVEYPDFPEACSTWDCGCALPQTTDSGARSALKIPRNLCANIVNSIRWRRRRSVLSWSEVFSILILLLTLIGSPASLAAQVQFTHGRLEVPTYTFQRSMVVPPLFESAGGRGLYPYAAMDRQSLSTEPEPVQYESLTLENEYLKVVILPELGGRIWSAWDKIAERHIFYYTSVIKPSSYNQRGAWPVGNIEVYGPYDAHMLTWPGEPWPWALRENDDGSKTLILSHIEHLFRNKLLMEVTLRPGHSFVELGVRLHNPNLLPNRYLLWTNAGIPATDGTRFIYPMTRTIGHDTSELGTWPVDRGVDLSWYRNNQAMLGVFGLDIYDDFIAAYDYEADEGTVCFTNRQVARGIKTWTWGTGEAGMRHLENYTDSGVPYIEVQSGRFVWDGNYEFINPGQTDGWTEYWYGVGSLGGVTTATRDVALNLVVVEDQTVELKLTSTSLLKNATIEWHAGQDAPRKENVSLRVGEVWSSRFQADRSLARYPLSVRVVSGETVLLDYTRRPAGEPPDAELAADSIPRDFGTSENLNVEERYQKGLTAEKLGRLEEARTSYESTLEEDPGFSPAHLRLGLLSLQAFRVDEAIEHFERVLERDPSNGEAHYYLAVSFLQRDKPEQASRHFYRLLPSSFAFESRDFGLGLTALAAGNFNEAERWLASAAKRTPTRTAVLEAYAFVLRRNGRGEAASRARSQLIEVDPTSAFARSEEAIESGWSATQLAELHRSTASHPQVFLELATRYRQLGGWSEIEQLMAEAISLSGSNRSAPYPLLYYYRALALDRLDRTEDARRMLQNADQVATDISLFPFRQESIEVLEKALKIDPGNSQATSLLADIYYWKGFREKGIALWRRAVENRPDNFVSLRNLGWALVDDGQTREAVDYLAKAVALRSGDLEITTGLVRLYSQLGETQRAVGFIRSALEQQPGNDQLVELAAEVEALNGNYAHALELLEHHQFGPRHQSYSLLRLYQAVQLLAAHRAAVEGDFQNALAMVSAAHTPPSNLGVDDFAALRSPRLLFFEALLHELGENDARARSVWEEISKSTTRDVDGEGLYWAVATHRLGRTHEVEQWFHEFARLVKHRTRDLSMQVAVQARYFSALYQLFVGNREQASLELDQARRIDQSDLLVLHAGKWLAGDLFRTLEGNGEEFSD